MKATYVSVRKWMDKQDVFCVCVCVLCTHRLFFKSKKLVVARGEAGGEMGEIRGLRDQNFHLQNKP